ncbi:hypothetical protein NQD34_001873, partial [Periophthalmus magnuspinnatus]
LKYLRIFSTYHIVSPLANLCLFLYRKRTISEVQLMHNVQEHKQVGERQDWLQEKLKDIIVTSVKPQHVR